MIKAFRDTWELGIHSYLTYLRDRLLLAREMLHESGSVFVQISDENVHHVREIMDDVFGVENFISQISFKKTVYQETKYLANVFDIILWYGKDKNTTKVHKLFRFREEREIVKSFDLLELENGEIKRISKLKENERKYKYLRASDLTSKGASKKGSQPFIFEGVEFHPKTGNHWKTHQSGLKKLSENDRLIAFGKTLCFKKYADDFPVTPFFNVWDDTVQSTFSTENIYVVQTYTKVIGRCLLMTTDPGDLVLDITCGSGTSANVAEQWGRRWITCDTSRVALTLAKQRLMTANFAYYKLAHPDEGVGSGFEYKSVPHITLKSIANNEPPAMETLYDQPYIDNKKTRITGPFTVEAVPAPYAKSFDELEKDDSGSDTSIARTGETHRQSEWRDELLRTGVRAKGGKIIQFTRVEPLSGTKFIQAEAETKEDIPKKVLVVFGPEHAPLEQRQVEDAWQEARALNPDMLLFCAFQFDDEAAKDIDELTPEIAGMRLLKAHMNADMFTDDLRKKRSSNESFWLVGQPDVKVRKQKDGKVQVEVMGFDYYNPKTGNVESGGKKNIAMWMLDTDYDNRSLFPSQVFFPMAGKKDGWTKLAKNLKAEIDEEKIESFNGTVSLSFKPGKTIAVKIIDDRGIESLRVIKVA